MFKVIQFKEDFDKLYPYKNRTPTKYPVKYPCLIQWNRIDGAGGPHNDFWNCTVIYVPAHIYSLADFLDGVNAGKIILSSE